MTARGLCKWGPDENSAAARTISAPPPPPRNGVGSDLNRKTGGREKTTRRVGGGIADEASIIFYRRASPRGSSLAAFNKMRVRNDGSLPSIREEEAHFNGHHAHNRGPLAVTDNNNNVQELPRYVLWGGSTLMTSMWWSFFFFPGQ